VQGAVVDGDALIAPTCPLLALFFSTISLKTKRNSQKVPGKGRPFQIVNGKKARRARTARLPENEALGSLPSFCYTSSTRIRY